MEISTIRQDAPRASAEDHPYLLPHQLAVLHAAVDLERRCLDIKVSERETLSTRAGILGDKPGSGKSYVVSALVLGGAFDHLPGDTTFTHTLTPHTSVRATAADSAVHLDVNLLVVPHNVIRQWRALLAALAPAERSCVVERSCDLDGAAAALDALLERASRVRVIAISAPLYPTVVSMLRARRAAAARVVFDEADSLRFQSPASARDLARFYWFVTASVNNLMSCGPDDSFSMRVHHQDGDVVTRVTSRYPEVNSSHIRHMLHMGAGARVWARPVSLTVLVADNAFIDQSFDLEAPEALYVACAAPLYNRILSGIASREILARLEAGDLDTALAYMHAGHSDVESNIIAAALRNLEVEMANARASLDYTRQRMYASDSQARAAEERAESLIARLEGNLANVRDRIQQATECLVCYSPMANKTVVPCCNNSFCLPCITTWVTGAADACCPMCKRPLRTSDFMVCRDTPRPAPAPETYQQGGVTFDGRADKGANLAALLRSMLHADRKLLFFCDNECALDNAGRRAMREAGIPFAALKGNPASIDKRVREFSSSPGTRALLINCSHYGCGLNLNSATDVILYHSVDPRMEQQIVGRAQRAPRSCRLRVWRFHNRTDGRSTL